MSPHMKNITIAMPQIYVDNLRKLQDLGMVSSRSDAVRQAVGRFLKKESEVCELFGYPQKTEDL